MYKHYCVKCLENHYLKCIWNIPFKDRFLGNDNVKYCPEYNLIMEKMKKSMIRGKNKKS
jgi:hypothetical protein